MSERPGHEPERRRAARGAAPIPAPKPPPPFHARRPLDAPAQPAPWRPRPRVALLVALGLIAGLVALGLAFPDAPAVRPLRSVLRLLRFG